MKYFKKAIIAVFIGMTIYTTISNPTINMYAKAANVTEETKNTVDDSQIEEDGNRLFLYNIEVTNNYPSGFTFYFPNVVYTRYDTIVIHGQSLKAGVDFKAEVYQTNQNRDMVRVGIYNCKTDHVGQFSLVHPIAASGDYAVKLKHNSSKADVVTVDCVATH